VSLQVSTGRAGQVNELLEAMARGRDDHQFFSRAFLARTLHDGQLEWVENADATVNVLATANRYGKTTVCSHRHYHKNVYKIGGEPRYMRADGTVDQDAFLKLKYHTVHTADLWETAALVWDDARKLKNENALLAAWVAADPATKPPHIDFVHGSRWKFRTLGDDASGIDGNSFYHISLDEAGWVRYLDEKMQNVVRVRVADVKGTIDLVGTFKPGISRDFYKAAVRASSYTGRGISFDHRADEEDVDVEGTLDQSIRKYLREFFGGKDLDQELLDNLKKIGVTADELADAATRSA
jgi:hypothetical protein